MISPMHNAQHRAVVVSPQAPLGAHRRESPPGRPVVLGWVMGDTTWPQWAPPAARSSPPALPCTSLPAPTRPAPPRAARAARASPLTPANVVPGQTVDPSAPGAALGQKALFAKKFASDTKATISPTDAIQSPCTAKLAGAKARHFSKCVAGCGAAVRRCPRAPRRRRRRRPLLVASAHPQGQDRDPGACAPGGAAGREPGAAGIGRRRPPAQAWAAPGAPLLVRPPFCDRIVRVWFGLRGRRRRPLTASRRPL